MVYVDLNSIGFDSISLWNVPASWSAWQCVKTNFVNKLAGMPSLFKYKVEKGGGSIITPLPSIHIINPDVDSLQSNPWLAPKAVIPKSGGLKNYSSV